MTFQIKFLNELSLFIYTELLPVKFNAIVRILMKWSNELSNRLLRFLCIK